MECMEQPRRSLTGNDISTYMYHMYIPMLQPQITPAVTRKEAMYKTRHFPEEKPVHVTTTR